MPPAPVPVRLSARALSLGDLIDLALRENADTADSWKVAVESAMNANKALGAFLPDVSINVGFNKQYQQVNGHLHANGFSIPQFQIQNSPSVFVSPGANVNWTLWDFGASIAQYNAAKAGLLASNLTHNRTIQGVVHGVQLAYFNYDTARGAFNAADANVDVANANLSSTQMKRTAGLGGLSDELQARQNEMQAALQREQARDQLAQARAQLFELAGLSPNANVTIAEQAPGTEPAPVLAAVDNLMAQALAHRPDLAARYAKITALEDSYKHAQRAFLPSISFSAGVSRMHGTQATLTSQGVANPTAIQQAQITRYTASGFEETAQGGLSVSTDLTGWFTYNAVLREKRAEIDAAQADLHTALITAQHDVWLAVDSCQSARGQYSEAKELLDVSEKAYNAAKNARESGLQSNLDLLQAQQSYAQARYTLVTARAKLFTGAVDLAYATGDTPMNGETSGQ
ncbi:MAG TPA: TolC family protein [Opitutaceae bacterium]|jgi:outer membrane protein TolC